MNQLTNLLLALGVLVLGVGAVWSDHGGGGYTIAYLAAIGGVVTLIRYRSKADRSLK